MFILKRSKLEQIAKTRKVCAAGFERHAARAKEQEGVDFGNGVIGNGVDTYYPDGLSDAEYLRIAEHDAQHAMWLINNRDVLGTPLPSNEAFSAVVAKLLEQRGRRR